MVVNGLDVFRVIRFEGGACISRAREFEGLSPQRAYRKAAHNNYYAGWFVRNVVRSNPAYVVVDEVAWGQTKRVHLRRLSLIRKWAKEEYNLKIKA